jgi:hypothetical protein
LKGFGKSAVEERLHAYYRWKLSYGLIFNMTSIRVARFLAFASYLFMVVMNVLATTLPLNGQRTNEISDRYDTLFAPIGFTFAIWGVIYLLLGIYSVYQLVRDNDIIRTITPWFISSNILNGLWIISWHYEVIWVSVVIIAGLLVVLIRINQTTTIRRVNWSHTLTVRLPFAIYFGWVTVATVANVSALLVQLGWRGGDLLGESGWTVVILILAAAIGITTTLVNASFSYGAVFIWAYWGILSRHLASDEWNKQYPDVILTVQIILPVLLISAVIALIRWFRQPVVTLASTPLLLKSKR